MKTIDPATQAALVAAPESGLMERNVVTIFAKALAGPAITEFPFWNDLDTVTVQVIDGESNLVVNRDAVGDGAILALDRIPQSTDFSIRTIRITFSQIHPTVRNMVSGYNIRGAWVEVHRLLFNPATGAVVAPAERPFTGRIDKAPQTIPGPGDEGGIYLDVVDSIRDLTRSNPAKKSDETQKRRSGDRARRNIGTANVKLWWGQEKKNVAGSSSGQSEQPRVNYGIFGSSTRQKSGR